MTAQMGDEFMIQDRSYTMAAASNPIPFTPKEYGIIADACCTDCWRGFWCIYDFFDDELVLRDLYVNSKDRNYPEINGVSVLKESELYEYALYQNLQLRIPYTGNILVGNDFIWAHYVHMGLQRPWAYQSLFELVIEEGILLDVIDHSDLVQNLRNEIEKNPKKFYQNLDQNVLEYLEKNLSTDKESLTWWLDFWPE